MKCFQCGGPFHTATGHFHRPDVPVCGPCIRPFIAWVKQHTKRKWSDQSFYEAAASSVKAGFTEETRNG